MAEDTQEVQSQTTTTPSDGLEGDAAYVDRLVSQAGSLTGSDDDSWLGESSDTVEGDGASPADSTTEVESPAGQGETTPNAAPAKAADGDEFTKLAGEYGLDATNPAHRKLLEELVSARGAGAKADTDGQRPEASDGLTDFERSLIGNDPAQQEQPEAKTAEKPADAEGAALEPGKFGDGFDTWAGPSDALKELQSAWSGDEQGNVDLGKVNQIETALFMRRFAAMGVPLVKRAIENYFKSELGDVHAAIQANRQQVRDQANYKSVLDGLKKSPGFETVDKLYEPIDDNKIKLQGHEVPNTPINRVYQRYPELLELAAVPHKDPDVSAKLTIAKRLRAVASRWKEMNDTVPMKDAKELVDTGKRIEQKKQTDRTRQALNAGTGASGAGSKAPTDGDWFARINRPAGSIRVSDLLK